jgi:hypothetical protein
MPSVTPLIGLRGRRRVADKDVDDHGNKQTTYGTAGQCSAAAEFSDHCILSLFGRLGIRRLVVQPAEKVHSRGLRDPKKSL